MSMVCNLTRGRAEFAAVEDQVKALVAESEAARAKLEQLLQDDTVAYNGVTAAHKMPQDSAEQQAARSAAVQAGLVGAANVPLAICRVAVEVCRLAKTAAEIGNPRAVTDAGIAAALGEAAVVGASLNVKINLGAVEDPAYVQAVAAEVDEILAAAAALRIEVLAITAARLQILAAARGEKS